MMRVYRKHGLFLLGLMTLLFLFQGQLISLCYGQDGHLKVEPIIHSHCSHFAGFHSTKKEVSFTELNAFSETHDCKPCVDVPIKTVFDYQKQRSNNYHFSGTLQVKAACLYSLEYSKYTKFTGIGSSAENLLGVILII